MASTRFRDSKTSSEFLDESSLLKDSAFAIENYGTSDRQKSPMILSSNHVQAEMSVGSIPIFVEGSRLFHVIYISPRNFKKF